MKKLVLAFALLLSAISLAACSPKPAGIMSYSKFVSAYNKAAIGSDDIKLPKNVDGAEQVSKHGTITRVTVESGVLEKLEIYETTDAGSINYIASEGSALAALPVSSKEVEKSDEKLSSLDSEINEYTYTERKLKIHTKVDSNDFWHFTATRVK